MRRDPPRTAFSARSQNDPRVSYRKRETFDKFPSLAEIANLTTRAVLDTQERAHSLGGVRQ